MKTTLKEECDLYWSCTLGKKSDLNLLGKIVFFPLTVFMFVIFFTCEVFFTKR